MSTTNLFDPKTVSGMLEIPSSTLRRYAQLYPEYFSETAKISSKKRRYSNQDVLILKKIKELTRSRKTTDEIRAALQIVQESPETTDQPENLNPNAIVPLIAQFTAEIEQLRITQAETQSTVEQLNQRIDQLEHQLAFSRLPWWKRIQKRNQPE
jgi:DNA-binding transcriptional MerR regulator